MATAIVVGLHKYDHAAGRQCLLGLREYPLEMFVSGAMGKLQFAAADCGQKEKIR